jgi:hypothetical protein
MLLCIMLFKKMLSCNYFGISTFTCHLIFSKQHAGYHVVANHLKFPNYFTRNHGSCGGRLRDEIARCDGSGPQVEALVHPSL